MPGASERVLIGHVIPHEHRILGDLLMAEPDECVALVGRIVRDDVDHVLSVGCFRLGAELCESFEQHLARGVRIGRLTVVDGNRVAFVLDDHSRQPGSSGGDHRHPLPDECRGTLHLWRWLDAVVPHDDLDRDVHEPRRHVGQGAAAEDGHGIHLGHLAQERGGARADGSFLRVAHDRRQRAVEIEHEQRVRARESTQEGPVALSQDVPH